MVNEQERALINAQNPASILIALIVFAMLFLGLGGFIGQFILSQAGISDLTALSSNDSPMDFSYDQRMALRWANLIPSAFLFILSSLVVAFLVAKSQMFSFLQLKRDQWWRNLPVYFGIVLGSFPVVLMINWLNHQLPFPQWIWDMENSQTGLVEAILQMDYPAEFWLNMLVIAVVPAIGEELFFRGIIQANIRRFSGRKHLAVWVAAVLFSAIHFQFAGFLPRMLLGALLGYLFLWSQNLIVPIVAHFIYNGMQVVGTYYFSEAFEKSNEVVAPPIYMWLSGLILVIGCLYWLKKRSVEESINLE